MKLIVNYSKQASKFLTRNPQVISKDNVLNFLKKAVKVIILKQEINLDLKALKGEYKGYFRIRYRDIRIIFEITEEAEIVVIDIMAIDHRGNIY